MAEWLVRLTGHDLDLEALAREYSTSGISIIKDEHGYWLKSSEFASLNDAEKILTLANELLPIISGAGKVFLAGFQPLGTGHVVQISDDGVRHNFVFVTATVSSRASVSRQVTLASGIPAPQPQPPQDVEFASTVAQSEERVKKALIFFDRQHTWVNLYKVYELIRADVGDDMAAKGWTTKAEAGRFTQTANSVGAVGDEARHAVEHTQPPKKPMSLKEAEQFVRLLLANWIRSKR